MALYPKLAERPSRDVETGHVYVLVDFYPTLRDRRNETNRVLREEFIMQLSPTRLFPTTDPVTGETSIVEVPVDFRAAFTSSSDYETGGVGAKNATAGVGVGRFNTATDHFIQVCRNNTNWELGSCDGSTISQSSAAGGDGNWHDFRVEWAESEIRLYVDDVLKITKTTNLPAEALSFLAFRYDPSTKRPIQLMGVKISWAAA